MGRPSLSLFALLAACAVLGPLQLNVYLPSLPLVQAEFGASVSTVQWTVSTAMFVFGTGLLLFGPLSDSLGRRPVLLIGLACFDVGTLAAALANGVGVLAAARGLQSAGAAMLFITARAVVADLSPREHLQRSVAQLTMIMLVGQMVAPLVGNVAMSFGGWRTIQYSLLVVGVAVSALVWRFLRESRPVPVAPPVRRSGYATFIGPLVDVIGRRRMALRFTQIGLLYGTYPAFVSIAPHLMIAVYARPPTEYAYYYALLPLGYFAGNAWVLRFGRGVSQSRFVLAGGTVALGAALCGLVLFFSGVLHPVALFLPAGLVLNFGLGLALPSATARSIVHASPQVATAWGLAGCLQQSIGACAVQLLGIFPSDTAGPVLGLSVAMLATALLSEPLLRAVKPPAHA